MQYLMKWKMLSKLFSSGLMTNKRQPPQKLSSVQLNQQNYYNHRK